MSQCAVCSTEMTKARKHYGGLSCYSCRAFFRRMTHRDRLAHCRSEFSTLIGRAQTWLCSDWLDLDLDFVNMNSTSAAGLMAAAVSTWRTGEPARPAGTTGVSGRG